MFNGQPVPAWWSALPNSPLRGVQSARKRMKNRLALMAFVLAACTLQPSLATVSPTAAPVAAEPHAPTQTEPPSATASPAPTLETVPEHRIGVRVVAGRGEVYDRAPGEPGVPARP